MGVYIKGITKKSFETLVGRGLFEGFEPNLIEVKAPHGRLIDENEITMRADLWLESRGAIGNTPTVIEAEVE